MEKIAKYNPIPMDDLKDLKALQDEIIDRQMKMKDDLYGKIAEMALGRPFTPEDGKDFGIARSEGKDYELVAYKDNILGSVRFKISYKDDDFTRAMHTAAWIFNPDEKDFKLP